MTSIEKLDAKVANERLKLFANLLNTPAASALVGSLVAPVVTGSIGNPFWSALVGGFGSLLHVLGHLVLDFLKSQQ